MKTNWIKYLVIGAGTIIIAALAWAIYYFIISDPRTMP
jgi:hypothetical protein